MQQQNQRLIVISNRLPVSVEKTEEGWKFKMSSGGLVAALSGLKMSFVWIGWPGCWIPEEEQEEFKKQLYEQEKCIPVFLDDKLADEHYNGFSNGILWYALDIYCWISHSFHLNHLMLAVSS